MIPPPPVSSDLRHSVSTAMKVPGECENNAPAAPSIHVVLVTEFKLKYSRLADALRASAWQLQWFPDAQSALRHIERDSPDLVICDAQLQGSDWQTFVQHINGLANGPAIIAACPEQDPRLWAEAINCGARDVLATPFDAHEVVTVLRMAWLSRMRAAGKGRAASAGYERG